MHSTALAVRMQFRKTSGLRALVPPPPVYKKGKKEEETLYVRFSSACLYWCRTHPFITLPFFFSFCLFALETQRPPHRLPSASTTCSPVCLGFSIEYYRILCTAVHFLVWAHINPTWVYLQKVVLSMASLCSQLTLGSSVLGSLPGQYGNGLRGSVVSVCLALIPGLPLAFPFIFSLSVILVLFCFLYHHNSVFHLTEQS